MEAREKAMELVQRFIEPTQQWDELDGFIPNKHAAKTCALITVDEILNLGLHDVGDYRNDQSSLNDFSTVTWYINYWQEVKQEIEKL